jgi:hypothetical protein
MVNQRRNRKEHYHTVVKPQLKKKSYKDAKFKLPSSDPEYNRNRLMIYAHGIDILDYDTMLDEQDYKCAICGSEESNKPGHKEVGDNFFIDHCHKTGKIRGLLCNHCNMMLGSVKDNVYTLQNAINYLEKHA